MKDSKSRFSLIREVLGNYGVVKKSRGIIFIVSHMRSRSTLLSHLLGSNQNICGHSELHIRYRGLLDIYDLKLRLMKESNFKNAKYLLDKILHNHRLLEQSVIESTNPKMILMTRPPIETIKSIKKMFLSNNSFNDLAEIVEYYKARMEGITAVSEKNKGRYLFIESGDLIANTELVLKNIQKYLELEESIKAEYRVFSDTGEAGKGDQSDNIKAGKILEIKADTMDEESSWIAQYFPDNYYAELTERIRRNCIELD